MSARTLQLRCSSYTTNVAFVQTDVHRLESLETYITDASRTLARSEIQALIACLFEYVLGEHARGYYLQRLRHEHIVLLRGSGAHSEERHWRVIDYNRFLNKPSAEPPLRPTHNAIDYSDVCCLLVEVLLRFAPGEVWQSEFHAQFADILRLKARPSVSKDYDSQLDQQICSLKYSLLQHFVEPKVANLRCDLRDFLPHEYAFHRGWFWELRPLVADLYKFELSSAKIESDQLAMRLRAHHFVVRLLDAHVQHELRLALRPEDLTQRSIATLREILTRYPGTSPVIVETGEAGKSFMLTSEFNVNIPGVVAELRSEFGRNVIKA